MPGRRAGGTDEQLETIVYGRFLDPESRKAFFETYKEIEALWEILSPSRSYAITSRPTAGSPVSTPRCTTHPHVASATSRDLASKTHFMVQDSAVQEGLGYLTKTVTFDVGTLETLRRKSGSDEAKVFNLVRGLREEVEADPDLESVLLPLKERAERILKDLEDRTTTGPCGDGPVGGAGRGEGSSRRGGKSERLSPRAFGVHWTLKDDPDLDAAGISTSSLAQEADALLGRFPNAAVNADEQRRLRAALYHPLLRLDRDERSRVVDRILAILLRVDADANA